MFLPSHIRRSRHGVFYYRLVFPRVVAEALGQAEALRSLHTKCPVDAKILGYQISATLVPILRSLRRIMTIDPKRFNPKEIRKLTIEELALPSGIKLRNLKTSDNPKTAKLELETLRSVFDADKAGKQRSPEALAKLAAEEQVLREVVDRAMGKKRPTKEDTLAGAMEAYIVFKKGLAESSKKSYREAIRLLGALCGGMDRKVHTITAQDCKDFNEALPRVPLHATKRGIPLRSATELLALPDDPDAETLSAQSSNQTITNLKTFLYWCIKTGRYAEENPFKDLARHTDGNDDGGAEAFTETELREIFNPDSFMAVKQPHVFWGSLLALFTGARANEIASLDLANFIEEGGYRCIAIRHTKRASTKEKIVHATRKRSPKQTKNNSSRRVLPLHPILWEVGLDDYLRDLQGLGAKRLFPTLPLDSRKKRDRYLSRDVNDYLKRVGVHEPRTKVLHSFRDTISDFLGDSVMDDTAADRWTGHRSKTTKGRSYRKGLPVKNAKTAFGELKFSFLPWGKIRYRKGRWNDYIKQNMCA